MAAECQAKGLPVIIAIAQRVGYPILGAFAAIVIGWFFLPAISMNLGFLGKNSVTFYQGQSSSTRVASRHSRRSPVAAALGSTDSSASSRCSPCSCRRSGKIVAPPSAAPLVLMLPTAIIAYSKMSSQLAGEPAAQMRSVVSIGFGGRLALICSAYVAWQACRTTQADKGTCERGAKTAKDSMSGEHYRVMVLDMQGKKQELAAMSEKMSFEQRATFASGAVPGAR